jgi:hypothetical protein
MSAIGSDAAMHCTGEAPRGMVDTISGRHGQLHTGPCAHACRASLQEPWRGTGGAARTGRASGESFRAVRARRIRTDRLEIRFAPRGAGVRKNMRA